MLIVLLRYYKMAGYWHNCHSNNIKQSH